MSEEKGGFLQKLSKPFKNSSDSKEESHDVVIQDAYLEGKKKVESEHNGPSAVIQHAYLEGKKRAESEHRGTSAHSATSSTATTGGHTVSRDAEGSISSSDSNIITSTSTGKLLSSPPRVQRKPIDKQLAGDFTNHKKPIEKDVIAGNQTATKNTSKKSDLVENSNPAYTDESTVREGSGYYFNPKDTQAGVYNNKDAGDYSEATQAKIDKNHKLKTEPTAYTIEREAYEAGKEKFHKEQASAKSSHASHGKSVGAAAAGAGATAAAVGAHNHKNAASTSNNTYDSELNKVNAQIDANQKKINALGTNSDVDAASTTAVYEEPYASHKATTKSNENDGATYLGVVGGRKNAPSSTTSSSNSKQIKKDAYNQGVHNSAYNQGTDAAIEDSTSKSRRYDTGATTSSPSTTANKSHGTTASVAGVFGGLGATAATGAAVESKTHSSHSTPTTADHDSILKESYAAGQSKAKSEHHSTRSTGEAIPGVSGSGPTVYGETSLPSSTVRDSSTSSNSPGVFAGVAGALGATAAALGLSSANTPTDPHSTSSVPTTTSSTKDPTTATTTSSKDIVTPKKSTIANDTSSSTKELPTNQASTSNKDLSTKKTSSQPSTGVIGGIASAAGAVGSAVAGAGIYSTSKKNDRSLVEVAAQNDPEVDKLPAHKEGRGVFDEGRAVETGDDVQEVPPEVFQNQNTFIRTGGREGELRDPVSKSTKFTNSVDDPTTKETTASSSDRDLTSEIAAHNKKHGITKDDRSLIEIAEENSSEVKNAAAHKKGKNITDDDVVVEKGEDVQDVPESVFQNQNTYIRTGGKEGSLSDKPGSTASGVPSGVNVSKTPASTTPSVTATGSATVNPTTTTATPSTGILAGITSAVGAAAASTGLYSASTANDTSSSSTGKDTTSTNPEVSKSTGSTSHSEPTASGFAKNKTEPLSSSHSSEHDTSAYYQAGFNKGAYESGHHHGQNAAKSHSNTAGNTAAVGGLGAVGAGIASALGYSTYSSEKQASTSSSDIPPVGHDKSIGNKYHSQHEEVKSELETAANKGTLGNVGHPATTSNLNHHTGSPINSGSTATAAGITGAGASTAASTGSKVPTSQPQAKSDIVVTVKGIKDTGNATKVASDTVEQLKGSKALSHVKEINIDSKSGVVTDEHGEKLTNLPSSYSHHSAVSTNSHDAIPRSGHSATATTAGTSTEPISNSTNSTNTTNTANTATPHHAPLKMPGSFD